MLEHLDQVGGALTAAGVVVGAIVRLWGAIKKKFDGLDDRREAQFKGLKDDFKGLKDELVGAFNKHEQLDQRRHEDNLYKFSDIRVALARAGFRTNGNGNGEPSDGAPP
jgi:hypothetical protein